MSNTYGDDSFNVDAFKESLAADSNNFVSSSIIDDAKKFNNPIDKISEEDKNSSIPDEVKDNHDGQGDEDYDDDFE